LQSRVPSTRMSVSWTFVTIAVLALVIVLVFILENLHATDATFFGIRWRIPLGLDLLLAAVLGAVSVLVIGLARTLQLRLLAHRTMRARDEKAAPASKVEEEPSVS
jgi:lipopolysaccharide assembly protein A